MDGNTTVCGVEVKGGTVQKKKPFSFPLDARAHRTLLRSRSFSHSSPSRKNRKAFCPPGHLVRSQIFLFSPPVHPRYLCCDPFILLNGLYICISSSRQRYYSFELHVIIVYMCIYTNPTTQRENLRTRCDRERRCPSHFFDRNRRGETSISSTQVAGAGTTDTPPGPCSLRLRGHVLNRKTLLGGLHLSHSFVSAHPHP